MSQSWCRRWLPVVGALCLVQGSRAPLAAQQTVASDRPESVRADETLARLVTVDLDRVSLTAAVKAIAKSAGIRVQYRSDALDTVTAPVTLHADRQALGAVLDRVLNGTRLRAVVLDRDLVEIASGDRRSHVVAGGDIRGTVTDAKTKRPLRGVSVVLDDSAKTVRTDDAGHYAFANVGAGPHRITIRHIGFGQRTRLVTVADDATATVDVALESTVNTLDQVVVTATGAQRYRELGHVVSQINADSVVREAPVSSLSELLTARVPGLQVLGTNGGTVGGDVSLRLRGTTTTSLDPQPIIMVDGVRYKNTTTINGQVDQRPFGVEQRSPLNDLNVNDIETVEVVKGPSASTLYGPDAANGVIVITTKRGKAGRPQWHVYAYPDLSDLNVGGAGSRLDRPSYQGWGHIPGTTDVFQGQCMLAQQAEQQCVLDSLVLVPDPSNTPQLSVLAKQRPQWHSGISLSGGRPDLSYFFSGNRDSQTGALRLSPEAATLLKNQLGVQSLSKALRSPNTQETVGLHANIAVAPTSTSSVTLVGNYTQATQRAATPIVFTNQANRGPLDPGYTYTSADSAAYLAEQTNASAFFSTSEMQVHRLTTALTGSAQPFAWLHAEASVGTDLDNTTDRGIIPAGTEYNGFPGTANDNRRDNTNRNARIGLTAMAHPGVWSARTSFGTDYAYTNLDGLNTQGNTLAPGSSDITTAQSKSISRQWVESVQLGGYLEEVVGLHDRLFLTGSLRLDGATSFGDAYAPKPFPKVGVSWVASDEPWLRSARDHGLSELRLRYSYGAASRYPTSAMKWGEIDAGNGIENGQNISVFQRVTGANPDLRPEKSTEAEYGADATFFSVIRLGLSWYNRHTNDELQRVSGPSGGLSGWRNVGNLAAQGVEATLGATLLDTRQATFNVTMTYNKSTDVVRSIGQGIQSYSVNGGVVVGYPIGAAFGTRTIGYIDSAGGVQDGYITQRSEVLSSPMEYLGSTFAPRTYTLTPALALFASQVRISALFDRQSGGVALDLLGSCWANAVHCPEAFLKSTPLLIQAIDVGKNFGDFVRSSDFTRWRELSVTGDLPPALRQRLRLSRASVSVQARNLALWTPSKSPDPESVPGLGTIASGGSFNGAIGVPQPTSWTIRFDISP